MYYTFIFGFSHLKFIFVSLPKFPILNLYKIIPAVFPMACHQKFVFKHKLNFSSGHWDNPNTLVLTSGGRH